MLGIKLLHDRLTSNSLYRLFFYLQVNWTVLKMVPNDFPCPKTYYSKKYTSLECLEFKLLLEVLLDLLQPIQAVLSLQVNLRPLEMVSNDYPYSKTWGFKKIRSLACLEAELLREDVLDLLQPIYRLFFTFRSIWGLLKGSQMIPHNSGIWLAWKLSYSAKTSLTSYIPYRLFLTFGSIWGLLKWSQMIPLTQKPEV